MTWMMVERALSDLGNILGNAAVWRGLFPHRGSCPRTWCSLGVAPCFPESVRAGHVPGTAECMMMGLSLSYTTSRDTIIIPLDRAVERFRERIVGQLSWPAEVQHDIVLIGHRSRSIETNTGPWSILVRFGRVPFSTYQPTRPVVSARSEV
jgi:hypothetical protein